MLQGHAVQEAHHLPLALRQVDRQVGIVDGCGWLRGHVLAWHSSVLTLGVRRGGKLHK